MYAAAACIIDIKQQPPETVLYGRDASVVNFFDQTENMWSLIIMTYYINQVFNVELLTLCLD